MISRLGEKVRRLRTRAGLSQTALAERLGMRARGYISEVENGKKTPPAETIVQIAKVFGVTTDYLLLDELDEASQPE